SPIHATPPVCCRLSFLSIRPPPISTLFPYTTLFRSSEAACEIIRRRMQRRFNRVFVNKHGRAWTTEAVNCAFCAVRQRMGKEIIDRKSTRLNSSHVKISYAVFCLKKKKKDRQTTMEK